MEKFSNYLNWVNFAIKNKYPIYMYGNPIDPIATVGLPHGKPVAFVAKKNILIMQFLGSFLLFGSLFVLYPLFSGENYFFELSIALTTSVITTIIGTYKIFRFREKNEIPSWEIFKNQK